MWTCLIVKVSKLRNMFVLPGNVEKIVIKRLKITYSYKYNLVRQKFFSGNLETKRKSQEELEKKYKYNLENA